MKLETSIMSQTSYISGPYEHSAPCRTAAELRGMVEQLALTGEGASHALYPDSEAEEAVLRAMVADGEAVEGHCDAMGLPMYYQVV